MLPEIVEKFQTNIDLFTEALVERIEELLPDLTPEEQEATPVLMSDSAFATCLVCINRGMTIGQYEIYGGEGCYFKCDISLANNNLSFTVGDFIGISSTWVDHWNNRQLILDNKDHYTWHLEHEGDLYAQIWNNGFKFRLYYEGAYHDSDIHLYWNIPNTDLPDCKSYDITTPGIRTGNSGVINYSVDADEILTYTPATLNLTPNNNNNLLYSIKGYPFICNTSDITDINDFVTNNNATNNYSTTYTTADNKTITVYYGDNYIITHVNNNDPVSYDDIKNALNIAVDQINDDNDTDMNVPDYPIPEPPDIDDDIEVEMDLNDAAFGEGLSHYYVTTVDAPVLSDISEAMSSWNINNTGKDLYKNLLSCRITKVGPIPSSPSTFVIYGEELLHGGSPITISKIAGNPSMDLGEYEIQPKFNDFRDYAPYTKIEMFIPYCGWVALPSHVMSSEEKPKIITGTLLCDIIAGTCKAVIKCNDTVVAEASGFTAVDVPFTGENVGMKMAGIASAITSYGNTASKTVGNIASGGMSGGAGAGASAAGGLVGLLGSYAQLHSAFNANYTEICGKTGDGCNVAGLNKVYIKIQRPKTGGYEAPDFVPEGYGHTTGFIAMKKSQISDCEGLIVCANADTSGIGGATDRERQMIKNLLESGIIVRHTEPEP